MSTKEDSTPFEILLIEDNPAEVRLVQEVFKQLNLQSQLFSVGQGTEALAFLRREPPYTHASLPDLILLDLNLPGKHGLEVLAEINAEPQFRRIPSVVLSTSQAAQDIVRSYELCANCYLVKPTDLDEFRRMVNVLHDFTR